MRKHEPPAYYSLCCPDELLFVIRQRPRIRSFSNYYERRGSGVSQNLAPPPVEPIFALLGVYDAPYLADTTIVSMCSLWHPPIAGGALPDDECYGLAWPFKLAVHSQCRRNHSFLRHARLFLINVIISPMPADSSFIGFSFEHGFLHCFLFSGSCITRIG